MVTWFGFFFNLKQEQNPQYEWKIYFDRRQSKTIFDMELRLIHHFIKHDFKVDLVLPFHTRVLFI